MRRLSAVILLFAVLAAVDLMFLIRKHEDVIQFLLDGSDASGVLAPYHVDNLLWKMETLLVNDLGILDNVDGDIVVNESKDVQVNEEMCIRDRVTGATQGMGLETLIRLAGQGYEVHFTYRRSEEKAKELMERYPGQVYGHKLDQGKAEEIEKADFLTEHEWYGVIFNAALGSGTVKEYTRCV